MGTMGTPPNQILIGMALFLTAFIMAPTATRAYEAGVGPYLEGRMEGMKAIENVTPPVREFLLRQTREKDIALFYSIAQHPYPRQPSEVSMRLLVPAYVLSELRTAFEMGFLVFIPFLLVDIVISSILMSMGMVMLPPAMIALPIKIMLFVVVDGWTLVVDSLARSFA
jgi:flagellar biosynthetic protein FliP